MASTQDFPTRGKVLALTNGLIVIQPRGTNYELHLKPTKPAHPPVDASVEGLIRLEARKIWTVPSGGNFVSPIFGPPRIVQGRVRYIDERTIVLQSGGFFIIDLPGDESAIDLANGPVSVGSIVNATALPGATFEVTAIRETFDATAAAAATAASAAH